MALEVGTLNPKKCTNLTSVLRMRNNEDLTHESNSLQKAVLDQDEATVARLLLDREC
jgi:hypothetical protein